MLERFNTCYGNIHVHTCICQAIVHCRFGKEETATVRRLESVQERLRQQQEALGDLESHQAQQPGAPTQPIKIEKIRFLTREIQNALKKVNAWNKGQLDGLERSQNTLEEELEVIEKALANTKIDEPAEDIVPVKESQNSKSENGELENNGDERDSENPVLHEDFHTWVSRTGGHNGGWSAEDHLYMVTLTHRHASWRRMPDKFLEEIWSGVRAVSSREAVRRHVEWYVEYCVRRDRQKMRIGQWRERRAAMKEEERRHSATSIKLHKTSKAGWLTKNKEKLRKLEEWKRLKTVKKEIEEAEELLRVAEKKSKIEQRMERRNTQIKRYLKVREEKKKVQQRREEEEKRIKELERKHRREMNRMVLSQYHEKDMERIQWKVKQKADEQVMFKLCVIFSSIRSSRKSTVYLSVRLKVV